MTKTLTAVAAAAALAAAAVSAPSPAEARNGRIVAGILGGLAAGAFIGSAFARPHYYGYYGGPYYGGPYYGGPYYAAGPYYGGPYYGGPYAVGPYPYACHWRRERVWDGFGWAVRRVRVC
jgi:hypothetical protein